MIFISYRSTENDKALFIRHLCEANGIQCWKAPEDIHPGKDYSASIPEAIRNCSAMIILLTEAAQKSKWILREITAAENKGKRVIPLRMDQTPVNDEFDFMLNHTHFIEACGREEQAYEELIRELWIIEGIEQKTRVAIPGNPVSPEPVPPGPIPPEPIPPEPVPPNPDPHHKKLRRWILGVAVLVVAIALSVFLFFRPAQDLQIKYDKGMLTVNWPKDEKVSEWKVSYSDGRGSLAQTTQDHSSQYFGILDQGNLVISVMPANENERLSSNMYSASFTFPKIEPYAGYSVKIQSFQLLWRDKFNNENVIPLQSGQSMDLSQYDLILQYKMSMTGAPNGEPVNFMTVLETPSGDEYKTGHTEKVYESSFGNSTITHGSLNDPANPPDLHGEYKLHLYINGMYWGYESLILE